MAWTCFCFDFCSVVRDSFWAVFYILQLILVLSTHPSCKRIIAADAKTIFLGFRSRKLIERRPVCWGHCKWKDEKEGSRENWGGKHSRLIKSNQIYKDLMCCVFFYKWDKYNFSLYTTTLYNVGRTLTPVLGLSFYWHISINFYCGISNCNWDRKLDILDSKLVL